MMDRDNHSEAKTFQLDEFYLDLQANGNKIRLLDRSEVEHCPYPGLRPFRTSEFQLFKGREGQAEELLIRLRKTHFLAVIGSSGTGKSSLIRAGLIPQLFGGYLHEAGSRWNIAICRPGRDPIENLSIALASVQCRCRDKEDAEGNKKLWDKEKVLAEHAIILPKLLRSVYGILDVNEGIRPEDNGTRNNLLIIIDQFEELFRFERKSADSSNTEGHFVNLLLKASLRLDSSVYVVITMRSEFLGECVKYRGLPEIINEGQYLVPQLDRVQVKEVIEGPLILANRRIEPGLAETLINEIEQTRLRENLDQLPILQHALMRTYKHTVVTGGRDTLQIDDYEAIGGMGHALALHAESKYKDLADPGQSPDAMSKRQMIAKIVFQALTDLSAEQKGGRRPVRLARLYAITGAIGASQAETDEVINAFRDLDTSFIMPPANTALTPGLIIDISHESLMRNWERLNEWMEEEVRQGELYTMLQERRALYDLEEDKDNWMRGILLKELLKWRDVPYHNSAWAARYHKKAEPEEAADLYRRNFLFLQHSEEQNALAEEVEKKELQNKIKIEEKERLARTRQWSFGIAAAGGLLLGAFAFWQMLKAERNQVTAEANLVLAKKGMFGIYLRDSTDWWRSPMLNQNEHSWLQDTLFALYGETRTHRPNHKDSVAGARIEQSMSMLKDAYDARLYHWGNFLYLIREARRYDRNYVTSSVLDSLLLATIPYSAKRVLDLEDRAVEDGDPYLLGQSSSAGFILVNRRGIYQYYFDMRRPKVMKVAFPIGCEPLSISARANQVLTLQGRHFVLYTRGPDASDWIPNLRLSALLGAVPGSERRAARHRTSRSSRYFSSFARDKSEPDLYWRASFMPDGSQLAIYLGASMFRIINLNSGQVSPFPVGGLIRRFLFSHKGHQLLACTDDSVWLTSPGRSVLLADSAGANIEEIDPTGWLFSVNDSLIFGFADSARYCWNAKGQYLGKIRIDVRKSNLYLSDGVDSLLYIQSKGYSAARNGDYLFVQGNEHAAGRRYFPWHETTLGHIYAANNGSLISSDRTTVYSWDTRTKHLLEGDIDRWIDSSRFYQYYVSKGYYLSRSDEAGWMNSYRKAAEFGPLDADIDRRIGAYYFDHGKWDSAASIYRKILAVEPSSYEDLCNLGKVFDSTRQNDSSLKYYFRAAKIEPNTTYIWDVIGNAYSHKDMLDSSLKYYRKAIRINPRDEVILDNMASSFSDAGQYDSSILYARKALAIDNHMSSALSRLGTGYYYLSKYDSALRYFLLALETDKKDDSKYNDVALTYEGMNKYDSALYFYTKALSVNHTDAIVWVNRSDLYNRSLKNYQAGLADADSGLKYDPRNGLGYGEQGYAYLKLNRLDSGYNSLIKAKGLDPSDYHIYYFFACYYALRDKKADAMNWLGKAKEKGLNGRKHLDREEAFDKMRTDSNFQAFCRALHAW